MDTALRSFKTRRSHVITLWYHDDRVTRTGISATNQRRSQMIATTKAAKLICMVFTLAAFSVQSSGADSAQEMAALQAADQSWLKAYNSGDADALANLYDEHAALLAPGTPSVNGRAAIRAFFAHETAESAKAGVTFSLGPKPTGGVSGDMGWQSGTYAVKDKAGKVVDTGKYLSVSMKKDGKWLYVRDTWNSDGPTK
jgi:ketosteroid isomerase-like protein